MEVVVLVEPVGVEPLDGFGEMGGDLVLSERVLFDLDFDGAGAAINNVPSDGPADEAGLESGDVIVKIGERTIESIRDLRQAMASQRPENVVEVTVKRGDEELQFDLKLGKGQ